MPERVTMQRSHETEDERDDQPTMSRKATDAVIERVADKTDKAVDDIDAILDEFEPHLEEIDFIDNYKQKGGQ